jgi:hypothetical protein
VSSSASAGKPSLKVPKENNRFLCWPAAYESSPLLDNNQAILSRESLPPWFRQLRKLGREQALLASQKYMSSYAPGLTQTILNIDLNRQRLVIGGHQPELFHPGVWFKNFLIAEIGSRTNSIGMQVIVDHDVAKSDTLRVPSCSATKRKGQECSEFALRSIPLPMREESQPRMPWHATLTGQLDPLAWDRMIASVEQSMLYCGLQRPLLVSRKKMIAECIAHNQNIGDAFSQFRHRIEMENGVLNLEVPIGHLCTDSAFGFFVHHCVRNANALWSSYNGCRNTYRNRHKIRNQAQPVLELLREGDWFELPFWIYQERQAVVERKRLWVCNTNNQLRLSDHFDSAQATVTVTLPWTEQDLPTAWETFRKNGICIRPRALMTTLYLRCFVADLFVHGIGGGTYDELTDDIMRDWIGIEPPVYMTSSASLHLPVLLQTELNQSDPVLSWSGVQRELQLMRSVPERFLESANESHRELIRLHSRQIAVIPDRGHKLKWHQEMARIKQLIVDSIEPKKLAALAKLETILRVKQQNKILKSREYSFVLFEELEVVGRLTKLAKAAFRPDTETGK